MEGGPYRNHIILLVPATVASFFAWPYQIAQSIGGQIVSQCLSCGIPERSLLCDDHDGGDSDSDDGDDDGRVAVTSASFSPI